MRLFLWLVFVIVVVGIGMFVKGQANSVNLEQICGKEVPWYDAMFLDSVKEKADCEKYQ
jgi:hypothetical protein